MKYPLDPTPYDRDPRSQAIQLGIADGTYVYVQDKNEDIFILPDGPHQHPKVLGNASRTICAGDLTVFSGKIRDLTTGNWSF